MTVGVLQLELSIGDAMSLKDKRRVIKSLKDRLAAGHNVSVAEVGAQDEHRRSVLAVAMVGSDKQYVEGALEQAGGFRPRRVAGESGGLSDRFVVNVNR